MRSPLFLDHFQQPRHVGELLPPALKVTVENPACGDLMILSLLVEGQQIREARYQVRGCAASIAAGSALMEWLPGKTLAELRGLTADTIIEAVGGLPVESRHAAALCVDAVRAAVRKQAEDGA